MPLQQKLYSRMDLVRELGVSHARVRYAITKGRISSLTMIGNRHVYGSDALQAIRLQLRENRAYRLSV